MRTSAWQFARDLAERTPPDALWVSDYVDLPTLLGLLPAAWSEVPITAYFHENQATYPRSENATEADVERDYHLAWTNALTAIRADHLVFNSEFHKREFADGMSELFRIWPKPNPRLELEAALREATVISPGVRVSEIPLGGGSPDNGPLRVLFNQRWEHDKDPGALLAALIEAREQGARFELLLLGERYRELPSGVAAQLETLRDETLACEFVTDRASYTTALGTCDLVVSTARHEFFGIAVVEALAAGCTPLLPNRLAYPEVIPAARHRAALYETDSELVARLVQYAAEPARLRTPEARAEWRGLAEAHDAVRVARELDAQP